jgi:hypothetical protein
MIRQDTIGDFIEMIKYAPMGDITDIVPGYAFTKDGQFIGFLYDYTSSVPKMAIIVNADDFTTERLPASSIQVLPLRLMLHKYGESLLNKFNKNRSVKVSAPLRETKGLKLISKGFGEIPIDPEIARINKERQMMKQTSPLKVPSVYLKLAEHNKDFVHNSKWSAK